ncbi:MAG: kelch repeat-containing protein [Chitinophagaceae bacterium]
MKALAKGVYKFKLKVTDNGGLSSKDTVQIIVNEASDTAKCNIVNRSSVNARLVPIGNLSQSRDGIAIVSAGDKILFAGGANEYNLFSTVDIYDVNTQHWSTASLSIPRYAIAAVAAGNKFFSQAGITVTILIL